MAERYVGKVVSVPDEYSVVVNKGAEHGVKRGDKFLIVGLGDAIYDPDTGDLLDRLEIIRGKAEATHVQDKISTLTSCDYEKGMDVKQIKKTIWRGGRLPSLSFPEDTVTETITPGEQTLKTIANAQVGDLLIKA